MTRKATLEKFQLCDRDPSEIPSIRATRRDRSTRSSQSIRALAQAIPGDADFARWYNFCAHFHVRTVVLYSGDAHDIFVRVHAPCLGGLRDICGFFLPAFARPSITPLRF